MAMSTYFLMAHSQSGSVFPLVWQVCPTDKLRPTENLFSIFHPKYVYEDGKLLDLLLYQYLFESYKISNRFF